MKQPCFSDCWLLPDFMNLVLGRLPTHCANGLRSRLARHLLTLCRVRIPQVRRASLDVGGGMHNATYQQVYQQAYQHVRVQPQQQQQQLYQASSLYAPTSDDGNLGRQVSTGGHAAGTDQACC